MVNGLRNLRDDYLVGRAMGWGVLRSASIAAAVRCIRRGSSPVTADATALGNLATMFCNAGIARGRDRTLH